MAIQVTCAGCKKTFNVDDKFAGKTGPCPNCKAKISVPEKKPEVVVHAPAEFSSGGKSVSGKILLKPIARKETRVKPVTWAIIGGVAVASIVYALVMRAVTTEPLHGILCGLGLLLVAPPLVIAAYTFLRDDELEPYRGNELLIRASICGAIYALLWGIFAYVKYQVGPIDVPYWFLVAPPFFLIGGMAGKFSLDLETSNGFFHYAFYVAVTFLLGMIAGVSQAIWNYVPPGTS
jgi:hypothetical protein